MSHETQIDEIGALDVEIKALQKERKVLIDGLSGLKHGKHDGLSYVATIVEKIDWRLDTKALKIEMGEPWYDKRCKQVMSRAVRTAPRKVKGMFAIDLLTPYYGRDYKSKKAAQSDFDAGKDFRCASGQATTKSELIEFGYRAPTITCRNANLRKVFTLNM